MVKLYCVNEALKSYSLVDTFADEESALRRLDSAPLLRLRSFVRFELHLSDGSRVEIARGKAA